MGRILKKVMSTEFAIAMLLIAAVLNLALPYGIWLMLPINLIFSTIALLKGKIRIQTTPVMVVMYLSMFLYMTGMLISDKIYKSNRVDLLNILTLLAFSLVIGRVSVDVFSRAVERYEKVISVLLPVIAVVSLYKFVLISRGIRIGWLSSGDPTASYPWGTSLHADYNMFALSMLAGILASLHQLFESRSRIYTIFIGIGVVLMLACVIFAGSRRGWVTLLVVGVYYFYRAYRSFRLISSRNMFRYITQPIAFGSLLGTAFLLSALLFSQLAGFDVGQMKGAAQVSLLFERFESILGDSQSRASGLSSRTTLWADSAALISTYHMDQILLGEGFSYLQYYASREGTEDGQGPEEVYPHNSFISAMHYSGVIGVIAVTCLLAFSFLTFYKKRKYFQGHIFLLYILSLLFCLISGNSIFSIRILPLLTLIISSIRVARLPEFVPTSIPLRDEGVSLNLRQRHTR